MTCGAVAGCKKKNDNPAGPGNTSSTWTGTLTRPTGLGVITVNWPAVTDSDGGRFSGPLTLTFNGVTITTTTGQGNTAGNSSNGYTLHVDFHANQGEIASLPTCSVHASSLNDDSNTFPSPYKTINIAMNVQFNGCGAFIGNNLLVNETQQLNLTK